MALSSAPYAEALYLSRRVSPYYKDSHFRLQRELRQYVSTQLTPHCAEWERTGSIPAEVYANHSKLGYTAVSVYPLAPARFFHDNQIRMPADIPIEEWDGFHDLIFIDEVARSGSLGMVWGMHCGNCVGVPPLINFGNEEQMQRWLPDVLTGRKRFCLGITEPDAGSDVAGIKTVAERKGDGYVVNGAKKWITNGLWADYCTAAVRTGGPGRRGISALIIDMKAKGVTCRKLENSGVGASGSTYIEFDDVYVPKENLLGPENGGFDIVMSNFNHERIWLACTAISLARVCAQDAYEYALVRETFGKALIENQVIQHKISGFGRAIEPVQAFMEQVVGMVEHERKRKGLRRQGGTVLRKGGKADEMDMNIGGIVAQLKYAGGRAMETCCRDAQQILGGAGYNRGGRGVRIEQISRDVRVMCVGGGSEEVLSELAFKIEVREMERIAGKKHDSRL